MNANARLDQNSKKKLSSRCLSLIIRKKETQKEYWPRLTKEKSRNTFIKTDFGKWVDEDVHDGSTVVEADGMDLAGMGGLGGMGVMVGMGGMGVMLGMG